MDSKRKNYSCPLVFVWILAFVWTSSFVAQSTTSVQTINVSPEQDLTSVLSTNVDVVVQLEEGRYTFSQTMSINNGLTITLRGVSKGTTLIDGQHLRKAFSISNGGRLVLSDLTIANCNSNEVSLFFFSTTQL